MKFDCTSASPCIATPYAKYYSIERHRIWREVFDLHIKNSILNCFGAQVKLMGGMNNDIINKTTL